jgi:excisionase family DNA binding protein
MWMPHKNAQTVCTQKTTQESLYHQSSERIIMSIIDQLKAMDHALTVKELATILHLGKTVVYEMVRRGAVPCIRFGYTVRFDPHEIAVWLKHSHMK